MKKPVRTRSTARTLDAARSRKAARAAKRSRSRSVSARAARTTVVAALGAGLLLQGGQEAQAVTLPIVLSSVVLSAEEGEGSDGSSAENPGETSEAPATETTGTTATAGPTTTAEPTPARSPEKTADETPSKVADKSANKTANKTADKTPSKAQPGVTPRRTSSPSTAAPTSATADPAPTTDAAAVAAPTAARAGRATATTPAPVVGKAPEATARTAELSRPERRATAARVTESVARNLLTRVALGLVGIVPTPPNTGGTPSPTTPSAPSGALLLAQWALFRRGGSVFNQSPVASPTSSPTTTGLITGDLHATDPDGDALTYTVVTAPTRGTVSVADDGTFTYTPGTQFASTGGTDSFTVLVRDNASGSGRFTDLLRGALGRGGHPVLAARLFGPHAIAVTIPVVVAPPVTNTPPTVPTTLPTPTVTRGSGAVTGSLGVRDTDGDALTFTVVEQPGTGTVTLDQDTGTYTFTPNAAARRVAAGTIGVDTVTFTVMVSDGEGGQTPVDVTVAVDPGPAEVVAALPVGEGAQSLYASPDGRRIYAVGSGAPSVSSFAAARGFSALDAADSDGTMTTGSTISIIDAGSNTLVSTVTLPGQPDEVRFSPDGSHVFVTTHAGETRFEEVTVTVIDVATDTVVATVEAESRLSVSFDPAGRHAYFSDYYIGRITVLDLQDDSVITLELPPYSGTLLFTPDGRRLYVPSYGQGTLTIIDPADHSVVDTLEVRGNPQLGPDGTALYVLDQGYETGTLTVIDTRTNAIAAIVPVGGGSSSVRFGAGNRYAYVSNYYGDTPRNLTLIDTADHSVTTIALSDHADYLQTSPDGTRGYIVDRDTGSVMVVDLEHGVVVMTVDTTDYEYSNVRDAQFDPDGTRFYVADTDRFTIINIADDTVTVIDGNGYLGFVPDGSAAYVLDYGDADGATLRLVSTADDSVRTFAVPVAYAGSVYFDPAVTRAYVQGYDGVLTVVNLTDGTSKAVPVGQPMYVPQFSPDGRQLFVGGYDSSVDLEEATGSVVVLSVVDDTVWTVPLGGWPSYVSFSPDGTQAYVTSERGPDGTKVTVIDRSDGTVTTFDTSPYASDVGFSPDGRFGYIMGNEEVTFIDLADGARSVVPASVVNNVSFSADGRYAYILDSLAGTAVVVALDDLPQPSTLA